MGNSVQQQVQSTVDGDVPVAQTVIIIEEEAAKFEKKIAFLVREVESLREENRSLQVYKSIYESFSDRIRNVFDAVAHAADGNDERECIEV